MNKIYENLKRSGFEGSICEDINPEYELNVSQFNRKIESVLIPKSVNDVLKIVTWANQTNIKLFPVSGGKNWGFGSRLPVHDHCVVVDLRDLNQIREIDLYHGYAVIEPGVTQAQLASELEKLKAKFYLDVTGSGKDTSIIGNALDRGVAYQSLKVNVVSNFEVILGNGTYLKTGLNALGSSKLNSLYPHGIGPGLHHLFFNLILASSLLPQ